jgi:Mn-dependent DtxR family transcriptional regulator
VEALFFHPYTKISSIEKHLKVTRKTASNYLKELESIGLLSVEKRGRETFYLNIELYKLFKNV